MQRTAIKAPSYTTLSLSAEDGQNAIVYGPKLKALYWIETTTIDLTEAEGYEYGVDVDVGIAPVPAATVTATHVFRAGEHGRHELIASLNFGPHHSPYHTIDTITFANGEAYELDDFFKKKGFPSTYVFII